MSNYSMCIKSNLSTEKDVGRQSIISKPRITLGKKICDFYLSSDVLGFYLSLLVCEDVEFVWCFFLILCEQIFDYLDLLITVKCGSTLVVLCSLCSGCPVIHCGFVTQWRPELVFVFSSGLLVHANLWVSIRIISPAALL